MSRIFITGDVHGVNDYEKLWEFYENGKGRDLTENDYVIVCGDMGCVWDLGKFDASIQNLYEQFPWTTLFVDGNHENHNALDAYEVDTWNGGKVHFITNKIIHLMRGQIFTINGINFFTMGGAASIDKEWRTENVSWWAREMPSISEYAEAIENLDNWYQNGNAIDVILSHCAAKTAQRAINLGYENNELTSFLDLVITAYEIPQSFFGHYHENCKFEIGATTYVCLYDKIIELFTEDQECQKMNELSRS